MTKNQQGNIQLFMESFWKLEKHRKITDFLCIFIVVAVAFIMVSDVMLGQRPITGDHSSHYFKAWYLRYHLIPEGKLFGWSNTWFAGYPINYSYPFFADLIVAVLHIITGGLISFSSIYAIVVGACYMASGVCVYIFGRYVGGRAVGVVASILYVTDTDAHPLGGWLDFMWIGVWPCPTSIAIGLLCLWRTGKIIEIPSWKNAGILAAVFGIALLFHPLQFVHLGIAVPLFVFCVAICDGKEKVLAALPKIAIAALIGFFISAISVLPFASTSDYHANIGYHWKSYNELISSFMLGHLFPRAISYFAAFCPFGILMMLVSKRSSSFFCAMMITLLLLISSSDIGRPILWTLLSDFTSRMEFERFGMILKPYALIAAAYSLCYFLKALGKYFSSHIAYASAGEKSTVFHHSAKNYTIIAAVIPFIAVLAYNLVSYPSPSKKLTISTINNKQEKEELARWINTDLAADKRFFRIGINLDEPPMNGELDLSTMINRPIYNVEWTPSLMFKYMPRGLGETVLKNLNVRYIITTKKEMPEHFSQVKTIGKMIVYEYSRWSDTRVSSSEPMFVPEIISYENEEIVFRSDLESPEPIVIHNAYFPRWKAYIDGVETPISKHFINTDIEFISLPMKKGEYKIVFELGWPEKLGFAMTIAGIYASLMLLIFRRK